MSEKQDSKKYLLMTLSGILICSIILRIFIIPYKVNGNSMFPTLEHSQYGVCLRTAFNDIERFDVVIIKTPDKYLVKRVIGLPNEHIQYKDNNLYINDIQVMDIYNKNTTDDFDVYIGNDEYFCLGDNRQVSKDSRVLGCFKLQDISGNCGNI